MVKPRRSVKDRRIGSPVLTLNVDREIRRLKTESEWVSGMEDGITLVKYPHMRIVLVALRRGKSLREHRVAGPMSVFVVSGKIVMLAGESEYHLKAKDIVTLRKNIPHDVRAAADSVFLLTLMAF